MSELLKYSRLYYEKWGVTPIPIKYVGDQQKPLIEWTPLYNNPEPVLIENKELWERACGVAILPRHKHAVIDIDKFESEEERKQLAEFLARDGYGVVITRRGLHIHFLSKKETGELRIYRNGSRVGEGGGSKCKHMWASPPTNRNGYIYKFYNSGFPEKLIEVGLEELKTIIEFFIPGIEIVEIKNKDVSGGLITLNEIDPIQGIDKLTSDELIALLVGLYHAIGCNGLRDLVLEWHTTGMVKMRKFGWSNRTSRFYFLHTVAATLALLGATEQQTAEVLNRYEDLDGKPHDSHKSALWTIYKWKKQLHRRLYVLTRGECPFCTLRGYKNCGKNPVMRVYWWLQSRGREVAEELVQYLLSKKNNEVRHD